METKVFASPEIRVIDEVAREVESIVSDESTDLYSEKILTSGWDLSYYKKTRFSI